jgi:hypothetical protein
MTNNRNFTEEISVLGSQLGSKIKELIEEGNVRRILIQDMEGKTLLEIPLNLGVAAGAGLLFLAPILAGIGAIATVATRARVVIERYEDPQAKVPETSQPRTINIDDDDE